MAYKILTFSKLVGERNISIERGLVPTARIERQCGQWKEHHILSQTWKEEPGLTSCEARVLEEICRLYACSFSQAKCFLMYFFLLLKLF